MCFKVRIEIASCLSIGKIVFITVKMALDDSRSVFPVDPISAQLDSNQASWMAKAGLEYFQHEYGPG